MIQYSESIANALHSPVMYWGFPDSSVGKESTCNAETPVRFLGQEDLLEKGQATPSSILGLPLWLSW